MNDHTATAIGCKDPFDFDSFFKDTPKKSRKATKGSHKKIGKKERKCRASIPRKKRSTPKCDREEFMVQPTWKSGVHLPQRNEERNEEVHFCFPMQSKKQSGF
jgi:hypothetical protein